MDIPNIDDMPDDELIEFHKNLSTLTYLVQQMRFARSFRKSGRIELALGLEKNIEKMYKQLPREWRW